MFGLQFFDPFKPRFILGIDHFTGLKILLYNNRKLYLLTSNKFYLKIIDIFHTNKMHNKITILALF